MKNVGWLLSIGIALGLCLQTARAQTSTNTVIGVVAAEEGLPLLSPDQVPTRGTFWQILPTARGTTAIPWPVPPPYDETIYSIANGQFLVDDSTNDASDMSPETITNMATPILNLIDMEQSAQANFSLRAMSMDSPFPPGTNDDGGTNSYFASGLVTPDYGTNLWVANL